MSDQTVFSNEPAPAPTPEPVPSPTPEVKPSEAVVSPDPTADLLKTITNDNGVPKYASVEDAIKSIPHAQGHIHTIEQENAQLKEQMTSLQTQMEKMSKMEEMMEQLTAKKEPEQPSESFGEQQIMELIQNQMGEAEKQKAQLHNQQAVANQLTEKFGDASKAEEAYKAKAAEMDIPVSLLNDLAAKSPKAVMSYFQSGEVQVPSKSVEGSINTANFNTPAPAPKGRSPMLAGSTTADLIAAWERAGTKS